jgi:predicted nucleic acid-binding protein
MKLTLDSSVLAKLFFEEEDSDSAIELMEKGEEKDLEFISSDLVVYEVGNTIWKNLKGKKKDGRRYVELIFLLNVELLPIDADLASEAIVQAQKYNITYYDAVHVALSKANKTILVTQNKELLKKVKSAKSIEASLGRIEKIQ